MATYKVLQDIEAEDKLLGPLTLKQFVFAGIALGFCAIAFIFGKITIVLAIPWLIPIGFFGFMAAPIGRDQPNDIWLAARIRFLVQPRKRIWNQSGLVDLVTVTAPKRIEKVFTDNLSQHEVRSRLGALASTLDSRGWAVKNVNVNMGGGAVNDSGSDRLISIASIPQEVPTVETDVTAADDIMDPMSNMVAQRFDAHLKEDQQKHIQQLREQAKTGSIQTAQPAPDYSFITNPQAPQTIDAGYTTFSSQVVAPHQQEQADSFLDRSPAQTSLTPEEQAVLEEIHKNKTEETSHPHERVLLPLAEQQRLEQERKAAQAVVQTPQSHVSDVTIHELSTLPETSVASLASLAEHAEQKAKQDDGSFNEGQEISLH